MAKNPSDHARHARIGADQFAVVIPRFDSEEGLIRRIEAQMEKIFGPLFHLGDTELKIAVRVGVACYPNDGREVDVLLGTRTPSPSPPSGRP